MDFHIITLNTNRLRDNKHILREFPLTKRKPNYDCLTHPRLQRDEKSRGK